jgi:uncharacterized membrane protein
MREECPLALDGERNTIRVMSAESTQSKLKRKGTGHPFRSAVIYGLGVLAPPLFTLLIFLWIINTTKVYVLEPMTAGVREALVWSLADIRTELPLAAPSQRTIVVDDGRTFHRLDNDTFIPQSVYDRVRDAQGETPLPQTGKDFYRRYVDLVYLKPYFTIPFFVCIFLLLLYLVGKFMAVGIGRFFWNLFEQGIHRLPVVRGVYSGVKQVTDFLFKGQEFEFTRIVAVEYPRKGIWSLGFVTSESILDIHAAANEPVLAILIPASPLPMTGVTITALKSECIDLNMTVDQALQFIISCGVVIPPQQIWNAQTNDHLLTKPE